jgi:GNAT superfamily N-acetyltransferase
VPRNRKHSAKDARYIALADIAAQDAPTVLDQATEIFFETSLRKNFETSAERNAFLARWFGHYVAAEPRSFLFAIDGAGAVRGYLAGCIDSFDGSAGVVTSDISYYTAAFCRANRAYPSHFHINVKPGFQGRGVGRRLLTCFVKLCATSGSSGIHVVTGAESPAVLFYEACGFRKTALIGGSVVLAFSIGTYKSNP